MKGYFCGRLLPFHTFLFIIVPIIIDNVPTKQYATRSVYQNHAVCSKDGYPHGHAAGCFLQERRNAAPLVFSPGRRYN